MEASRKQETGSDDPRILPQFADELIQPPAELTGTASLMVGAHFPRAIEVDALMRRLQERSRAEDIERRVQEALGDPHQRMMTLLRHIP